MQKRYIDHKLKTLTRVNYHYKYPKTFLKKVKLTSLNNLFDELTRINDALTLRNPTDSLYQCTSSWADFEQHTSFTENTIVDFCSVAKQFLIALISRIVEQNKIQFDAPEKNQRLQIQSGSHDLAIV